MLDITRHLRRNQRSNRIHGRVERIDNNIILTDKNTRPIAICCRKNFYINMSSLESCTFTFHKMTVRHFEIMVGTQ